MRRHAGLFSVICLIGLVVIMGSMTSNGVEALSYQSDVGVGFTFDPTLSVSLSNNDLIINNLTPGTALDSNVITVNVATNAAYGYDLFSTVGNTTNATTELRNGNNSFTSLSSNVETLMDFSDNKWGYSYSIDSGSSWVSGGQGSTNTGYAGLPLYTETGVKLASASSNTNSSVQFKIAAKAGVAQASGEYTNVVNFTAVANVAPMSLLDAFVASDAKQVNGYYKMQDMTSNICGAVDDSLIPSELQLIDERDNKLYWVAKLADGNCWMTQNLDFDIVDNGANLNYANTDVPINWTDAGRLSDTSDDTTWSASTTTPDSYDPGDLYWNGVLWPSNQATCEEYDGVWGGDWCEGPNLTTSDGTNAHYHLGNYYNWTAAVAMSNSDSYGIDDVDVDQSICPAGWTLPKGGSRTGSGSFVYLSSQYSNKDMWDGPLYFPLSGDWYDYLDGVGDIGSYWSSVVHDLSFAYFLVSDFEGSVDPNGYYGDHSYGYSVRCVAR